MLDRKTGSEATHNESVSIAYPPVPVHDYLKADVSSAQDYYPFGMLMPGRYNSSEDVYLFGFNGQMKDNEVAGIGNHLDFKFRGYDSRLGRFWSVDPLSAKYPWNSSYAFAENRPIDGIDLEGKEWTKSTKLLKTGNGQIACQTEFTVKLQVYIDVTVNDPNRAKVMFEMMKPEAEHTLSRTYDLLAGLPPQLKKAIANIAAKTNTPTIYVYKTKIVPEYVDRQPDSKNSFSIQFTQESIASGVSAWTESIPGTRTDNGNPTVNNKMWIPMTLYDAFLNKVRDIQPFEFVRALPHELGHTAGATHTGPGSYVPGPNNLMRDGGTGTEMDNSQFRTIDKNVHEK